MSFGISQQWQRRAWQLARRQEAKHLGLSISLLQFRNRTSTSSVVAPGGPLVSLTTYGPRLGAVHLAIESIACGSLLPGRFILWLQDQAAYDNRSANLRRLERRGLEVCCTATLGPHTKYFPSLAVISGTNEPLVLADDDMLYPRGWLSQLMRSYREYPEAVSCQRAHTIQLDRDRTAIAPYGKWLHCKSAVPSFLHFATGASGSLLPPALVSQLRVAGTAFMHTCPRADDVWLHLQALRANVRVRQVRNIQQNYPVIPGSQVVTLMSDNVDQSQNDVQIRRSYTPTDIGRLAREFSRLAVANGDRVM